MKNTVKDIKNMYYRKREELGLTREKAAEQLGVISVDRIEKIENERVSAHPDEILIMAKQYLAPELCNYYCSHDCPIGKKYVPEIKTKDLSQIILETIASLNVMKIKQDRLIEISADGIITENELADFLSIQAELEKISVSVETLQLWYEQVICRAEAARESKTE